MKLALLLLCASLALASCVFDPDNRGGDRDQCDHDGHCDRH